MTNQRLRSLIKAAAENVQAANRPNPYVVGFMSKCAEAGLPPDVAGALLEKTALSTGAGAALGGTAGLLGGGLYGVGRTLIPAGLGAGLGAVIPVKETDPEKKKRKRKLNMLAGGVGGLAARNIYNAARTKSWLPMADSLGGAAVGGAIGALTGKKKEQPGDDTYRLRRALAGALTGASITNGLAYGLGGAAGGALGGGVAAGLSSGALSQDQINAIKERLAAGAAEGAGGSAE